MDVIEEIINVFGTENQMGIAQEECAELIQAISKYRRGMHHNIEEEVADVEIICMELRAMFDEDEIDKMKAKKLKKMKKMIEVVKMEESIK